MHPYKFYFLLIFIRGSMDESIFNTAQSFVKYILSSSKWIVIVAFFRLLMER